MPSTSLAIRPRWIFHFWYAIGAERFGMVSAMSVDEPDGRLAAPSPLRVRRRAYEAVQAVLSDDYNYERGVEGAPDGRRRAGRWLSRRRGRPRVG